MAIRRKLKLMKEGDCQFTLIRRNRAQGYHRNITGDKAVKTIWGLQREDFEGHLKRFRNTGDTKICSPFCYIFSNHYISEISSEVTTSTLKCNKI